MQQQDELYERKFEGERRRSEDYNVLLTMNVNERSGLVLSGFSQNLGKARQYDRLAEDRKYLQGDLKFAKEEADASSKSLEETKQKFQNSRDEYERELTRLGDERDELLRRMEDAQDQYSAKHDEVNNFAADWREVYDRNAAKAAWLEDTLDKAESEHKEIKERVKETVLRCAEARRRESATQSDNAQRIEELERRRDVALMEEERMCNLMDSELERARKENEKITEQYLRARAMESAELERANDNSACAYLESEVRQAEERFKNEESVLHNQIVASSREVEVLEQEFSKAEKSCRESQQLLSTQERILRGNQAALQVSREKIEADLANARHALDKAQEAEKREEEKCRSEAQKREAENNALARQIEKVRKEVRFKSEEAERMSTKIDADFANEKSHLTQQQKHEVADEKARFENIVRENRVLRSSLAQESLRREFAPLDNAQKTGTSHRNFSGAVTDPGTITRPNIHGVRRSHSACRIDGRETRDHYHYSPGFREASNPPSIIQHKNPYT